MTTTMNSTDVYSYLKRVGEIDPTIDCLAEAIVTVYGFDTPIDKRVLELMVTNGGGFTQEQWRKLNCAVTTTVQKDFRNYRSIEVTKGDQA